MRRIVLNLTIALRSLQSFKLRSALALLGVFLGTFSLIVVSNVSRSLAEKTSLEAASLGENLLVVRSGIIRRVGGGLRALSEATNLTQEDARALLHGSRAIDDVSPSGGRLFPVRSGQVVLGRVLITGVMPNFPRIRNFHVAQGSFVTEEDQEAMAKVAVLGQRMAEKLFREESPIGKHILVFRVPFQVIGVMEEKGVDLSGVDQDSQILVPLSAFLRRLVNADSVNTIFVRALSQEAMPQAKAEVEAILRQRHKIGSGRPDDFTVIDLKDVLALKTQALGMIAVLGRIAAAVSFLIGGIGILSIMILIVNERRVEIGIRRAVGSRKRDIVLQFLMESSVISLGGGMVGVAVGYAASAVIFRLSGLPFVPSVWGFALAFLASVAVGVLAGIYPSRRATSIQPVDIIRA
jgi:putative ABC transport system permease protein